MCLNFTCQGLAWGRVWRWFELAAHVDDMVVFSDGWQWSKVILFTAKRGRVKKKNKEEPSKLHAEQLRWRRNSRVRIIHAGWARCWKLGQNGAWMHFHVPEMRLAQKLFGTSLRRVWGSVGGLFVMPYTAPCRLTKGSSNGGVASQKGSRKSDDGQRWLESHWRRRKSRWKKGNEQKGSPECRNRSLEEGQQAERSLFLCQE